VGLGLLVAGKRIDAASHQATLTVISNEDEGIS
jgi:hypothetical protein